MNKQPSAQEGAHSPLPWHAASLTIQDANGNNVGLMNLARPQRDSIANAALIVQAVNTAAAKDARIKELEGALGRLLRHPIGVSTSSMEIAFARQVLAQTEGEGKK